LAPPRFPGQPQHLLGAPESQTSAAIMFCSAPLRSNSLLAVDMYTFHSRTKVMFPCGLSLTFKRHREMSRGSQYNPFASQTCFLLYIILPSSKIPLKVSAIIFTRYIMEDRFSAIRAAIGTAAPGDVVVIAGRGHCDYMEYWDGEVGSSRVGLSKYSSRGGS